MSADIEPPTSQPRRVVRPLVLLALAFVLVVVLGAWWFTSPAEEKDPILLTGTPVSQARRFDVDVTESNFLTTVDTRIGEVDGAFDLEGGTLQLVPEGDGWRLDVSMTLDASSLDVGNGMINGLLRRALKSDEHPLGIFIARSEERFTGESVDQSITLSGDLELSGTVLQYIIPAYVELDGETIHLSADIVVDATEFGVSMPSLFASDNLIAAMQVVAHEVPPGAPTPTPVAE